MNCHGRNSQGGFGAKRDAYVVIESTSAWPRYFKANYRESRGRRDGYGPSPSRDFATLSPHPRVTSPRFPLTLA